MSEKPTDDDPRGPRSFEELNAAADDGLLSPEDLKAELNNYAAAIRSEFQVAQDTAKNMDERVENVKEYFRANVGLAAAQIVYLATNAESDSTKLSAAKFVCQAAMEHAEKSDELTDLFSKLQATKPSKAKK